MQWIDLFDFFLFDFDGLLVDTEKLHYLAYQKMAQEHDLHLDWSFDKFLQIAHSTDDKAIQNQLYQSLPTLKQFPWAGLYQKKKELYLKILTSSSVDLMPGVKTLLKQLKDQGKKTCVVTNSLKEQIDLILAKKQGQNESLNMINYWVARKDYARPKPFADGYLKALELYGAKGDLEKKERVIGFEDSLKGLAALEKTKALPVLLCSRFHPQMNKVPATVVHAESFLELSSELLLKKGL